MFVIDVITIGDGQFFRIEVVMDVIDVMAMVMEVMDIIIKSKL